MTPASAGRGWIAGCVAACILGVLLAGCSRAPKPATDLIGSDTLDAPSPLPPPPVDMEFRPIRVLLTEPVDGRHAPVPRNESERFVFRQLYETLVDVDESGDVRPRLATSWRHEQDGRIWTFTLRDSARFSDGSPVDPAAVAAAWDNADWQPGSAGLLLPWGFVSPDSVTADPDGRLRVALTVPVGDRPALFAHPALAVTKGTGNGSWPAGSGAHRITGSASRAGFTALPADTTRCAPLRFRVAAGVDPRNLFPGEADLLVVAERSLLEYASLLPGFSVARLGTGRTYHLITPDTGRAEAARLSPRLREQMAADAISTGARAIPPSSGDGCPGLDRPKGATGGRSSGGGRFAFVKEDREGRRVTERLVALARAAGRGELPPDLADNAPLLNAIGGSNGAAAPAGFSDGQLGSMLGADSLALVLGLPPGFPDPCLEAAALMNRLGVPGGPGPVDPAKLRARVHPMFATSPFLACRSRIAGWRSSWDGVPILDAIGWVRQVP